MKSTEKYKRAILPKCNCGQDEAEYAWNWANQLEESLRYMLENIGEPWCLETCEGFKAAEELLSDNVKGES